MEAEPDQAATHLIDAEGERFGHRMLIPRVWELRVRLRLWDAFYVALAEVMDAPLLTFDERLARAAGRSCRVVVPDRY